MSSEKVENFQSTISATEEIEDQFWNLAAEVRGRNRKPNERKKNVNQYGREICKCNSMPYTKR